MDITIKTKKYSVFSIYYKAILGNLTAVKMVKKRVQFDGGKKSLNAHNILK